MVKAWCIWCEMGNIPSSSGYFWIHRSCARKMMDVDSDIRSIKKILEGTHNRNKKDKDKLNAVFKFIEDMEDFKRRWDNSMKIIEEKQHPQTKDS